MRRSLGQIIALLLAALTLWLPGHAAETLTKQATGVLMQGGESPDGRYAVELWGVDDYPPFNYEVRIVEKERGKVLARQEPDGYGTYLWMREFVTVYWHPSSKFVAFTSRPLKNWSRVHVYEVTDGQARKFDLPDYVQNALGRVDALETFRISWSSIEGWEDDHLSIGYNFDVDGGKRYQTTVVLNLRHGPNFQSDIRLKSVSPPQEGGY